MNQLISAQEAIGKTIKAITEPRDDARPYSASDGAVAIIFTDNTFLFVSGNGLSGECEPEIIEEARYNSPNYALQTWLEELYPKETA